jgi:hypothetical protein
MQQMRSNALSRRASAHEVAALFAGASAERTCASVAPNRWLWARELLVHDLGYFKFKGVAGTHATASVSTERLAGRTFATARRKGKAEQVVPGRGIILEVALLPAEQQQP